MVEKGRISALRTETILGRAMKTRTFSTLAAAGLVCAVAVSFANGVPYHKNQMSPIALADVPTPAVKPDPALIPRDVSVLEVNEAAIELIMTNEGLELEPYQFGGAWYIGYGHGRTAKPDMKITPEDALTLLREDLRDFEDAVRRLVKVPLTENQFSALVSFVYNCGEGTFSRSSILRHINNGEMEKAADALLLYTKAQIGEEKRELRSLVKRRQGERRIFLGQPQLDKTLRT
ncbi:lysozyme [Aquisalinus flavus]|nr:lysozyme [Aquisalinus flavus]